MKIGREVVVAQSATPVAADNAIASTVLRLPASNGIPVLDRYVLYPTRIKTATPITVVKIVTGIPIFA